MKPVENIMTGLPGYCVIIMLMQLLWWFGIHGSNVLGAVTTPFMTKMMAQNLELYQAGTDVTASGGNLWGALWQIIIIVGVSTLVYTPFVIASNREEA